MLKKLALREAPEQIHDLLSSGERYGLYDSIYECLFYGWLDLYEANNGRFYVETRISANNTESDDEVLERMGRATYGSDAILFQCIEKGYLDVYYGVDMWYAGRELLRIEVKDQRNLHKADNVMSVSKKLPF